MSIFNIFRKKQISVLDALQSNPAFREQKDLYDAMLLMCEDGVDSDELPNGKGEFGLCASNPVPSKTIYGSISYLSRICAPDGTKVLYDRHGSTTSDVSIHPIDIYHIKNDRGASLGDIYISPYHKKTSVRAPLGFIKLDSPNDKVPNEKIREETTRRFLDQIFPAADSKQLNLVAVNRFSFGHPSFGPDALILCLHLIKFAADVTGIKTVEDILEQDIYLCDIPLPESPSILSQEFYASLNSMEIIMRERLSNLDLNTTDPADLISFNFESEILWQNLP